jgi:hypothetical protein
MSVLAEVAKVGGFSTLVGAGWKAMKDNHPNWARLCTTVAFVVFCAVVLYWIQDESPTVARLGFGATVIVGGALLWAAWLTIERSEAVFWYRTVCQKDLYEWERCDPIPKDIVQRFRAHKNHP